jgi:hypothetical protein
MVTCPWCGTTYRAFLSSCQKCGGPIPQELFVPEQQSPVSSFNAPVAPPPPAPRPISQNYAWRLFFSDGWAITGLVFVMVGGTLFVTGLGLIAGLVTAFVGIPLAGFGLLGMVGGFALAARGYQAAQQTVEVLRTGSPVTGQITRVEIIPGVQVYGRSPWKIEYKYRIMGRDYDGSVTTLNQPFMMQPGQPAWVLYLPAAPEKNALYPHP